MYIKFTFKIKPINLNSNKTMYVLSTMAKNVHSSEKTNQPPKKGREFPFIPFLPAPLKLLILFFVYVILDILTTYLFISSGKGLEANPLMVKYVNDFNGYIIVFTIKTVCLFLFIVLLTTLNYLKLNKQSNILYYLVLGLSLIVVLNNLLVYFNGKNIFGF